MLASKHKHPHQQPTFVVHQIHRFTTHTVVKLITGPGTPHDYSTMSFLLLTSSLTRRFAQVHLGRSSSIKPAILPTISQFNMDQIRSFARQAPPKGARNKKQGAVSHHCLVPIDYYMHTMLCVCVCVCAVLL